MTTYDITLDDLAAMRATGASLRLASLAAGELSLSLHMQHMTAVPVPWVPGDRVTLSSSGRTVFAGTVRTAAPKYSGGGYYYEVSILDDWDVLDRTVFSVTDDQGRPRMADYIGRNTGTSSSGSTRTTVDIVAALQEILAAAPYMAARPHIAITGEMIPFAASGSDTCGALVSSVARWRPDLVTYFDYTSAPARLVIAAQEQLPVMRVAMDALDKTRMELQPRHDLVPPVCAFVWGSGAGRQSYILPEGGDLHAPGAFVYALADPGTEYPDPARLDANTDPDDPDAQDPAVYDSSSGPTGAARQEQRIRGIRVPAANDASGGYQWQFAPTAHKFWSTVYPRELGGLEDHVMYSNRVIRTVEPYGSPDPRQEPRKYDTNGGKGWDHVLVEGSISGEFRRVKWCYATIEQDVYFRSKSIPAGADAAMLRAFFTEDDEIDKGDARGKIRRRRMAVKVVLMDRPSARYLVGGDYAELDDMGRPIAPEPPDEPEETPDDDDPAKIEPPTNDDINPADYQAALKTYYDSTRSVPWEGSIVLLQHPAPWEYLGKRVCIDGGFPAWETMHTVVQSLTIDLMAGTAELTLGTRQHLSFDELVDRLGVFKARDKSAAAAVAGTVEIKKRVAEAEPSDPDNPDDPGSGGGGSGGGGGDTGVDDEVQDHPVSPLFEPVKLAASGAPQKTRMPFELFAKDGKTFVSGGKVTTSAGEGKVPETDVTGWRNVWLCYKSASGSPARPQAAPMMMSAVSMSAPSASEDAAVEVMLMQSQDIPADFDGVKVELASSLEGVAYDQRHVGDIRDIGLIPGTTEERDEFNSGASGWVDLEWIKVAEWFVPWMSDSGYSGQNGIFYALWQCVHEGKLFSLVTHGIECPPPDPNQSGQTSAG